MSRQIKGAICELPTSFNPDGSINYEEYLNMIEYQISCGIGGFFINGEGAEGLALDNAERIALARAAVKQINGRVPVIAGVVDSSRVRIAELVRAYDELDGVDAVCALPPMLVSLAENVVYDFYAFLAGLTAKDVYIYNQPTTGTLLSDSLVARLANDFDNIRGYKDTTGNIILLQNIMSRIDKPFSYFGGSDAFIWPIASLGGAGVISFIAVPFPKPVVEFYRLWEAGEYEKAYEKNMEIMRMRAVLKKGFTYGGKGGYYYATELAGAPIRGTRLPVSFVAINDEQKAYIEEQAKKVGWL